MGSAQKQDEEWDIEVNTVDGKTLIFPKCDPASTVRQLSVEVATYLSEDVDDDDIRIVLNDRVLGPDMTLKEEGLYHKAPPLLAVVERYCNIPSLCFSSSPGESPPGESPRHPLSSSSDSDGAPSSVVISFLCPASRAKEVSADDDSIRV